MGGGNLGNRGFAISGMIYPLLILTLFLVVQILATLQTRKVVLDSNKEKLLTEINDSSRVYTLEELTKIVQDLQQEINKKFYPVGSIYISTSSQNPESIYGGKWESFGTGRTLIGVNTNDSKFDTVEKVGGTNSQNITLTTAQLPVHTHTVTPKGTVSSKFTGQSVSTNSAGEHAHSSNFPSLIGHYAYGGEPNLYGYVSDGNQNPSRTTNSGNHSHTVTSKGTVSSSFSGQSSTTSSVGSGGAITIDKLQPYITVYMWKRIQ